MTNPAPIGHNNPPDEIEILKSRLETNADKVKKRMAALIEAVNKIPASFSDEETAIRVTDTIKLIQACKSAAEDLFVKEKKPFLDGGRTVDQFFNAIRLALDGAKDKANKPLTAYQVAKAETERKARLAAEAEQRRLEKIRLDEAAALEAAGKPVEAEAALQQAVNHESDGDLYGAKATAKPAGLTHTRGYTGAASSLRTVTVVDVTDRSKVDAVALLPYIPAAALQTAANAWVKANPGKPMPGLTIGQKTEAVTR